MTVLDQKINALEPGQSVRISGDEKCWVEVERSGDGQTLRFVRFTRGQKGNCGKIQMRRLR